MQLVIDSRVPGHAGQFRCSRHGLPEDLGIGRSVEAHEERPPLPERGRPQVACGPEQESQQRGSVRLALSEIHMDDACAFGGIELVHADKDAQGLGTLDRLLPGIHPDGRADPALRKEPLRFEAGLSAVAVVAPVDLRHRVNLRLILSMGVPSTASAAGSFTTVRSPRQRS